ncbi:MAG: protein translocase subunit SecD [Candidatus Dormibacteria bacterium]
MVRLTKWWYLLVGLIVLGALFIDTYSLTYRYLIVHEPLPHPLTSNPHLFGSPLYIHKGIDLQGGTDLTIAICLGKNDPQGTGSACTEGVPGGKSNLANVQQQTVTILRKRVNSLGVTESTVQAVGTDQVEVIIPGVNLQEAESVVGKTSRLYFATPVVGTANPKDPAFIADQHGLYDTAQFTNGQFYFPGYHWKIDTKLPATDVVSSSVSYPQGSASPGVSITFNSQGSNEWHNITQAAYNNYIQYGPNDPRSHIAIFLDNQVITAPYVQQGGQYYNTEITGNFTLQQATNLSEQINAGALPAQIAIVQSTSVSATLGKATVTESLIAGLLGLIIVIVFMIGYYRFAGLLASIALLIYAGIVLALYKLIPVTLSLAGLAGFVLSVGMAVDANVLIFERIRDELRHGRRLVLAVESGFRRAFPAIRDSNFSTIIACLVLWVFGNDVVKGFALTLGLGVMVSFFTAVVIVQILFRIALSLPFGKKPERYARLDPQIDALPRRGKFDIVTSRNIFFLISVLIIVPGIIAMAGWGFRLGLDFAGGNQITATLATRTTQQEVAHTLTKKYPTLQPAVEQQGTNTYVVQTLPAPVSTILNVESTLKNTYGFTETKEQPDVQVSTVGPSIATSTVQNSVLLVAVAACCIALYLALVFRGQRFMSPWRFSVTTLFKLLHDVFVLLGIWAILGHFTVLGDVNSLFITAVLTSIAFSIHDTIVVFDRIRENLRVGPKFTFEQIVNLSTLQTMTRSINTALTVVFVLLALILYGGTSIQGFVLALLIGIVTGTYSSIFNASTLLVAWNAADRILHPPLPTRGRRSARALARTS